LTQESVVRTPQAAPTVRRTAAETRLFFIRTPIAGLQAGMEGLLAHARGSVKQTPQMYAGLSPVE
jgi:hypothetical protein